MAVEDKHISYRIYLVAFGYLFDGYRDCREIDKYSVGRR